MQLNFNFPLRTSRGEELRTNNGITVTASMALADFLDNLSFRGQSRKLYDWAKTVAAGDVLEIDKTDASLLVEVIDTSEVLKTGVKGQLIEYIESVSKTLKAKE